MKTTTLFFTFLFLFSCSFAQIPEGKNNDFFFRVELDSLGICYGKCLVQPTWDTITEETVTKVGLRRLIVFDSLITDTVHTDYFILKNKENLFAINEYVDTQKITILIAEESRRLVSPSILDHNYINVTVNKLLKKGHQKWDYENNKITSQEWRLKFNPPVYKKENKRILDIRPGTTREEVLPAQYKTIISVYPKKGIKSWQLKNIHFLCNQFYLKRQVTQYTKTSESPEIRETNQKIVLVEKASITLEEIHNPDDFYLIPQIQKQLSTIGFYNGNFQGELTDKTKEAIINYQIKNNLPIGQLDVGTVNQILER